jgi:hypothetical protein
MEILGSEGVKPIRAYVHYSCCNGEADSKVDGDATTESLPS